MTEKDSIKEALLRNSRSYRSTRYYNSNRDSTLYATGFLEFRISDTSEVPFISLRDCMGKIWAHHNAIYVFPLSAIRSIKCATATPVWTALGGLSGDKDVLAKVIFKDTTYYVGDNIILDADFNVMYIKTIVFEKIPTGRFIPKKANFRINKTVVGKNDPISKQIMSKVLPMILEGRPMTFEYYDSRTGIYSHRSIIDIPSEIIINDMPWDIRRVETPNLIMPQMQASLKNKLHNSNLHFFNGMGNFALDEDV